MTDPSLRAGLTPEQQRFAEQRHAFVGARGAHPGTVCLYRQNGDETVRWIVDTRGRVLEAKRFGPTP